MKTVIFFKFLQLLISSLSSEIILDSVAILLRLAKFPWHCQNCGVAVHGIDVHWQNRIRACTGLSLYSCERLSWFHIHSPVFFSHMVHNICDRWKYQTSKLTTSAAIEGTSLFAGNSCQLEVKFFNIVHFVKPLLLRVVNLTRGKFFFQSVFKYEHIT